MKIILRSIGIFFCMQLLFVCTVFAITIPEPDAYVTDTAGIFSDAEEAQLESLLATIDASNTAQIAVLTVPDLEGYDIAQFSIEILDAKKSNGSKLRWVGNKSLDNWLFILIAPNERKRRIDVGYGIESIITDAIAKRIGEGNFPPYFRENQYAAGIELAITEIQKYLLQDPEVQERYQKEYATNEETPDIVVVIRVIIIVILLFIFNKYLPAAWRSSSGGSFGGWSSGGWGWSFGWFGGWSFGGGGSSGGW